MIRSLRSLVITLAGLSPLLAGLVGLSPIEWSPSPVIHAADGMMAEGSREDDSGTRSEQEEEDDNEEDDREVHLLASFQQPSWALEGRFAACCEAGRGIPRLRRWATPIRGPPVA